MEPLYDVIFKWLDALSSGTWAWFNGLTREEWIVVLGVAAACGFLCMRGYGSRSNF